MMPAPWRGARALRRTLAALGTMLVLAIAGTAPAARALPAPFVFGADLSYVNEMEDCGAQYRDHGVRSDPFSILRAHGANLVRVRLWNSPDWTRYSTLSDVAKTIARARAQHLQVLLDFHYSDTWADGDHQTIPKAWASIKGTDAQARQLYQFTFETLRTLDARGLMPDIVQVGNETNPELMGNGRKDQPIDWDRNAALFKAGFAAVRAAGALSSIQPRVMVHIAQPEHAEEWFPKARAAGITGFDLIGLSYYPKWSTRDLPGLGQTISTLRATYGVDVMVVETGYPWTLENNDSQANLLGQDGLLKGYPATPAGQTRFLTDLTQTVIDHGGTGVVYWEPAWVSTHCSTPFGQGSAWENATLFDFHKGNAALPAMDFMTHAYRTSAMAAPLPPTEGITEVHHPSWAASANIYEVNVRQYTPEGTFRAFEAHLPRLRAMGVDILWLMPINPISTKLRKGTLGSYYAISDYRAINPEYGNLDDFKHLVAAAHKLGMKVIVDWVANHTGWDNVWVSQHPDWYRRNARGELEGFHYTDPGDHHEETWADVIGLDFSKPAVRAGMIDAMSYWLKAADIDGFRCDVAWILPVDFWEQARATLDRVKPVFMLAEADTPELQSRAFDMTYDWALYHLMIKVARGQADGRDLAALYTHPPRRYPQGAYRMTFTSDHDENSWNGTDRELYGDGADAMAVLAATLPGMPLIYTGQESGLDKRLAFFDRDTIQWGDFKRAGFYAEFLRLKHIHPALRNGSDGGELKLIETGDPKVFAFDRVAGPDRVRVVVNLSAQPRQITLPDEAAFTLQGWGWRLTPTS